MRFSCPPRFDKVYELLLGERVSFWNQDIQELIDNGDLEDSNAPIGCPNCDAEASLYAHKYDEAITALLCSSCGHKEWATDEPSSDNPRRCQGCGDFVTDEDKNESRSIQCSAIEPYRETQCEQLAHQTCIEFCRDCGWFCEDEAAQYVECDSCGLLHESGHIVSFGTDFRDEFGNICESCFQGDETSSEIDSSSEVDSSPEEHITESKRDDQSPYLSHFIRRKEMSDDECCEVLLKILEEKKLESLPTGYFQAYHRQDSQRLAQTKAVCFTEGRLSALYGHAKEYSSFGLSFSKYFLHIHHRAAPVIHIHSGLITAVRDSIPTELFPFVSIMDIKKYDFHHEREWRVPADFEFFHSGIRTIFAPKKYHQKIREALERSCQCQVICLDSLKNL